MSVSFLVMFIVIISFSPPRGEWGEILVMLLNKKPSKTSGSFQSQFSLPTVSISLNVSSEN